MLFRQAFKATGTLAGLGCLLLLAVTYLMIPSDAAFGFMPHAHCFLFNQQLILLHGGSDLLI
ncbi:MAG: hypothetical protein V4710_18125, partial [Verrucomicrobiota bacterium]